MAAKVALFVVQLLDIFLLLTPNNKLLAGIAESLLSDSEEKVRATEARTKAAAKAAKATAAADEKRQIATAERKRLAEAAEKERVAAAAEKGRVAAAKKAARLKAQAEASAAGAAAPHGPAQQIEIRAKTGGSSGTAQSHNASGSIN